MADSLPDRRLRNRAGMASGTLLYKQEPPRGADPGAVGERRGIKAKNHIFTRRALQQIKCVLLNLKWLMDENVFLDKPSEIIPGKTVKAGWWIRFYRIICRDWEILKEDMNSPSLYDTLIRVVS